jgi:nucleoid DNA-binding protein
MAERALVDAIAAYGMPAEDAAAAADIVLGAIRDVLLTGKTVGIPDVGRLAAPSKPVWVPGSGKRKAREQRKVSLRNGAIIEKGEPYDV